MERFSCPVGVFVLLFDDEGKIIFQNRKKEQLYGLVGGHLDGGETLKSAAIREVKEEVGIDVYEEDLKLATVCHSKAGGKEYMQFYFIVQYFDGEITNLEPDKCSHIDSFYIDDTPEDTIPYIKEALDNIMNEVNFYESGF